jgi:hypothetical protein
MAYAPEGMVYAPAGMAYAPEGMAYAPEGAAVLCWDKVPLDLLGGGVRVLHTADLLSLALRVFSLRSTNLISTTRGIN